METGFSTADTAFSAADFTPPANAFSTSASTGVSRSRLISIKTFPIGLVDAASENPSREGVGQSMQNSPPGPNLQTGICESSNRLTSMSSFSIVTPSSSNRHFQNVSPLYRQNGPFLPNKNRTQNQNLSNCFVHCRLGNKKIAEQVRSKRDKVRNAHKKTARTSQKEEEVGELPRAT